MDFGFSPGGASDPHLRDLQLMFDRMANTTAIAGGITSVRQFIAHLDKTAAIKKPIGDLLIGTHANDEGQMSIPMFPGQAGWTLFETLEATLKAKAKSIAIPDALIGFKPGQPITHTFHIKGCNIGRARPFLVQLKAALGGHVNVTAPLFLHGATPAVGQGVIEYLGYSFTLSRLTRFPDRKTALKEFDAAQFQLIDASIVPNADWDPLIPLDPNGRRVDSLTSKLGTTLGKRTTILTPRRYRSSQLSFGPWTIRFPNAAAVPKTKSDQLLALESNLQTDPRFQSSHPFPQYEREGFANVTAFVSGYAWSCTPSNATLVCMGNRFLFTVQLAITDPNTTPPKKPFWEGNLIFNFYPNKGSTLTPITTGVQVTNPQFFVTV